MWNATLTAEDVDDGPIMEEITIEFDLFSEPEPYAPSSTTWQGTNIPKLEWNFTDPDKNDIQSDYLVEIYDNESMNEIRYNSSWINSSFWEHTVNEALNDGVYYWRVQTKDGYHAASNFSVLKKIMIDVTKPVGNITIEEDVLSVNDKLVELRINASDYGSGVADMQLIGDRGNEGPWEEYNTEKKIVLSPTDGLKKISVRFRDHAGIISKDFNDTVYFDLKGPYDVIISSSTHPESLVYYNSTLPVFSWEPPYVVTGIKGYSYTVDSTPLTEPTKVLYSPNGDLTGTYAGEFAGLGEGTWYFHITPCDVYDQWGNTTHFQFNIDSVLPVVSELVPSVNVWFGTTSVRTEATFYDRNGYGLDTNSIAYSFRKSGEGTFSGWNSDGMDFEILEDGEEGYPVKVRAWTDIVFNEGDRNAVIWRVSDMSGNGPVNSEKRAVKVDLTAVTFSDPIPDDEISTETTVSAGITITDMGGSGVDGKTVEYSISAWGNDDENFVNWTGMSNNMIKESLNILVDIEFQPGRDNYIKWRARDAVGNGYSVSEASQVWINSPPEPVIDAPYDEEIFVEGSSIRLSAEGTNDNEEDELGYYWVIKGKTSKKIVFRGYQKETQATLDQPGKYLVYLHVDDGYGFNESVKLDIEIEPKPTGKEAEVRWEDTTDTDEDSLPDWWEKMNGLDPNDSHDATQEMKQTYKRELDEQKGAKITEEGLLSKYWWVLIIIGALILIVIIGIVVVAKNKRKKEEETENAMPNRIAPERPYPVGSRDFYPPQYSQMTNTYQSHPAYGTQFSSWGSSKGANTQFGGRPDTYPQLPSAGSTGPGHMPLALPMASQVPVAQQQIFPVQQPSNVISPVTPSIQPAQQGQQYEQVISSPTPPQYSLPSFTSEQGTINLNRLALPPAAGDEEMKKTFEEPTYPSETVESLIPITMVPETTAISPTTASPVEPEPINVSKPTIIAPPSASQITSDPTPVSENPIISPLTPSPITLDPIPVSKYPNISPPTPTPIKPEPISMSKPTVIAPSSPITPDPRLVSETPIISPPTPSPRTPEPTSMSKSTVIEPPTPSPRTREPTSMPKPTVIAPPSASHITPDPVTVSGSPVISPPSPSTKWSEAQSGSVAPAVSPPESMESHAAPPMSTEDDVLDDIFGPKTPKTSPQPPPKPPAP